MRLLYSHMKLPDKDQDKPHNLTNVNDTFEKPQKPDLIINAATYLLR